MSEFKGTLVSDITARKSINGYRSITAAAQSTRGSIITDLFELNDELHVNIYTADESTSYGTLLWHGSFEEFKAKLKA